MILDRKIGIYNGSGQNRHSFLATEGDGTRRPGHHCVAMAPRLNPCSARAYPWCCGGAAPVRFARKMA